MEAEPSRKRPLSDNDDDDFNKKPPQKKVRFPKGKKVKFNDEVVVNVPKVTEDEAEDLKDSQLVAKAKSKRRNQNTAGLEIDATGDLLHDVAVSEMHYEDNEQLEDDGVKLEPFNLEQERKEGYFDQTGNYVEYVTNDIKDAWLDSIDAEPKLVQKHSSVTNIVAEAVELTSQDIGKIKRQIADVLEPGETVLQALRRLKGNRKEKMSAETKLVFDQLTEDAMKLMEDGDYNVYHEKQEVFQREAEGFEKLARARGEGTSSSSANGTHEADKNTSNNDDDFDMFADDDDEKAAVDPSNVAQFCFQLQTLGLHKTTMFLTSLQGTTTVAVWVIIMTPLQDCIAMQHLDSGTHITKKLGHMMKYKQKQQQQGKPIPASGISGLPSFIYLVQSEDEICNLTAFILKNLRLSIFTVFGFD